MEVCARIDVSIGLIKCYTGILRKKMQEFEKKKKKKG